MKGSVLITGGAGFIGSHLADELLRQGYRVRALDLLSPQVHPEGRPPEYLDPEVELLVGDIRDPQAVRRRSVLDIVPTGEVWARADARFALGYWHWSLLALPHPVPERIIGQDPEFFFFDAQFGGVIAVILV